jgi:hypothetical protein
MAGNMAHSFATDSPRAFQPKKKDVPPFTIFDFAIANQRVVLLR